MDIAKLTSKGQLTVPKAVREKLNLDTGSKVVFLEIGNDLVIRNAESMVQTDINEPNPEDMNLYRVTSEAFPSFRRLQEALAGLAEKEGITSEEELVEWMNSTLSDNAE